MGTRHLHGLKQLADSPFDAIELSAVCDISAEKRRDGRRRSREAPRGPSQGLHQHGGDGPARCRILEAVDVVTDPSVHHTVVCEALDLGLHVLVEKPLAITVQACQRILDAAARNERIVSVAENFRRDPSARIVRHLLDTRCLRHALYGLVPLGSARAIPSLSPPGGTAGRLGGFILDMAVHFTHLIRYQLGDFAEVYADARMIEPERQKSAAMSPWTTSSTKSASRPCPSAYPPRPRTRPKRSSKWKAARP